MIKKLTVLLFFLSLATIYSKDSTLVNTYSGVAGFNLSQISFTNWSQGGENSFIWNIYGNFSYNFNKKSYSVNNNLKLAYGRSKVGSGEFITSDNEIYLENILIFKTAKTFEPFFSNSFRSVITPGYDYSKDPKVKTSEFFDPGYLTQTFGFSYNQSKIIKTRLGIALQETFTNKFRSYSDDPDTEEIEKFLFESGIESVSELNYSFTKEINYKSKLRLFTRFENLDIWDVRWDNDLVIQLSKYFNVNFNVLLIYEKKQSLKTQLKQAMQLGLTYTIF